MTSKYRFPQLRQLLDEADRLDAAGQHDSAEQILRNVTDSIQQLRNRQDAESLFYTGLYHFLNSKPRSSTSNQSLTRLENLPTAQGLFRRSLSLARANDDWELVVRNCRRLGFIAYLQRKHAGAVEAFAFGLWVSATYRMTQDVADLLAFLHKSVAATGRPLNIEMPLSESDLDSLKSMAGSFLGPTIDDTNQLLPPANRLNLEQSIESLISERAVSVILTTGQVVYARLFGYWGLSAEKSYTDYEPDLRARIEGDQLVLYTLMNWGISWGSCLEFQVPVRLVAALSKLTFESRTLSPQERSGAESRTDPGTSALNTQTSSILKPLNIQPIRKTAWASRGGAPIPRFGQIQFLEKEILFLDYDRCFRRMTFLDNTNAVELLANKNDAVQRFLANFTREQSSKSFALATGTIENVNDAPDRMQIVLKPLYGHQPLRLNAALDANQYAIPAELFARLDTPVTVIREIDSDRASSVVCIIGRPDLEKQVHVEAPSGSRTSVSPPLEATKSQSLSDWLSNVVNSSKPVAFLVGAGISRDQPAGLMLANEIIDAVFDSLVSGIGQEQLLSREDLGALSRPANREDLDVRAYLRFEAIMEMLGKSVDPNLNILDGVSDLAPRSNSKPNGIHFLLAHAIVNGFPVLTTNFDSLIEAAAGESNRALVPIVFEDEYDELLQLWQENDRDDVILRARLYKLHGSFERQGADLRSTIIGTLNRIVDSYNDFALESLSAKWQIVRQIVKSHHLIVMGYSGSDYDLVPFFLETAKSDGVSLTWIEHVSDEAAIAVKPLPDEEVSPVQATQASHVELLHTIATRSEPHFDHSDQANIYLIKVPTSRLVPREWRPPTSDIEPWHFKGYEEHVRSEFFSNWSDMHLAEEGDCAFVAGLLHFCHRDFEQKGLQLVEHARNKYEVRDDTIALAMRFRIEALFGGSKAPRLDGLAVEGTRSTKPCFGGPSLRAP